MSKIQLKSKTSRRDLPARQEYYFELIHKGLHLGFRRSPKTGAETWLARILKKDGNYHRVPLGAATRQFDFKEAQAKAIDEGDEYFADPEAANSLTVSDLVRDYIKTHTPVKKNPDWERASIQRAQQVVFSRDIGNVKLADLESRHIAALQRELSAGGMGGASVNRSTAVLRAALNWGYKEGKMTGQPHKSVDRAKQKKPKLRRKFAIDQCAEVVTGAPDNLRPILTCMFYTGCRPVGARRLRVKDIELADSRVWFTSLKGDSNEDYSTYYTALSPDAVAFFRDQIAGKGDDDTVFTNSSGAAWSERNLAERFRHYRESAGLVGWDTMYVFRHSVITAVIKRGMPAAQAANEYGTSLAYIMGNYYERDDDLARKFAPSLGLAS